MTGVQTCALPISLGLSELKPFNPEEKVIELKIESDSKKKSLLTMDLRQFCNETASDSPAPGGGSVAALMGALGASLGGMVSNLSAGKRGWDDKIQYFSDWAVKAQRLALRYKKPTRRRQALQGPVR